MRRKRSWAVAGWVSPRAARALAAKRRQPCRGIRLSWIDPRAKGGALLYISDKTAATVFVYTYPKLALAGQLTGFNNPVGLCVDRRNGNVWVTDTFNYDAVEFAHGGSTPLRTLHDGQYYVHGCAVNSQTGDVAVVSSYVNGSDPGSVAIFKRRSSRPKVYTDYRHAFIMYFSAYDSAGNLFVDATHFGRGHFGLDELAFGSQQLTNIPWEGPYVHVPGGIQYDGTSLAIGSSNDQRVYRTSNGNVISTITLDDACWVGEFYIYERHLIAPSGCKNSNGEVLIYNYPAGGKPVQKLGGFMFPFGVAVSP